MQLADAPLCDSTGLMDVMDVSQRRKQVFLNLCEVWCHHVEIYFYISVFRAAESRFIVIKLNNN